MNRYFKVIRAWCRYRRALGTFRGEFEAFRRLAGPHARFDVPWAERQVCLDDREGTTNFDRHYFYHLAWAARVVRETSPARHVDISSQLQFCATVSAFVPMEFLEYHPPDVKLDGMTVNRVDLLKLPFTDQSVGSLSCMHVVEHVGLGRYGDPLDPDGDVKAMRELQRVVAVGGQLLFVVPVGRPRVVFNAHRIYSFELVATAFSELSLQEFALIPDSPADGGLIRHADPRMVAKQDYACGCFHFRRLL